jgi:hypothetical protein
MWGIKYFKKVLLCAVVLPLHRASIIRVNMGLIRHIFFHHRLAGFGIGEFYQVNPAGQWFCMRVLPVAASFAQHKPSGWVI